MKALAAATGLLLTGCTGLSVYQQPVTVAGQQYMATRLAGNLHGPGLACLLVHNSDGLLVWVSPACASGPDAGVALGTAGMQGAGVALGAAVHGASFPAHKGTTVNAVGSSATASGGAGGLAALDNFVTNVGNYTPLSGGPP